MPGRTLSCKANALVHDLQLTGNIEAQQRSREAKQERLFWGGHPQAWLPPTGRLLKPSPWPRLYRKL